MTYTLKREELGNGLLASVLEALAKAYKEIGAEVYVVGAAARDLGLKLLGAGSAPRRTMDLDVAVLLEKWDEYERLTEILIKDGFVKAPEKQRFYYCGIENVRYEVDIVPFGDIAQEEMVAWPPEGNPGTISLDVSTFDQTVAGAEWIASDLLNILSEDHKVYYEDMLDNEVAQQENSPLVNDLLDNAVIGTYDSIRRALARMSQILRR